MSQFYLTNHNQEKSFLKSKPLENKEYATFSKAHSIMWNAYALPFSESFIKKLILFVDFDMTRNVLKQDVSFKSIIRKCIEICLRNQVICNGNI